MCGDSTQGLQTHRPRSVARLTPKATLSLNSSRRAATWFFFLKKGVSTTKSALYR
jgi:hypothetical protein